MPSASLPRRRREELDAKLQSLDIEIEHWKAITDEEKGGLRRHFSQVRRLAAAIDGLLETTRTQVKATPIGSDALLDQAVAWENDILAAHAVWEIFRSKLVLRQDGFFRTRLAACDDLAWECYAPAMRAFAPDTKGPPLVYLTSTWSPFAKSRDASFQNEIRATSGTSGALTGEAFQSVLKHLPIPLVGLPWYQAFYVPGALVAAHEVGHVVEWDFGLTGDIDAALRGAGLTHLQVWQGWASEVFADVYGCLSMGPAFVGALIDLLSASKTFIAAEETHGGKYPARGLRIELALRTLERTGHAEGATRLRTAWEGSYGTMTAMTDYLDDAKKVVGALLTARLGGTQLTSVVSFPFTDTAIRDEAENVAFGNAPATVDPRALFAVVQWIHEHPDGVDLPKTYDALVDAIVRKGQAQYRFRGAPIDDKTDFEDTLKAEEERDRESGRTLYRLLADPAFS